PPSGPIAPGTTLLYRTARFRSRTGPRERNDGGPGRDLPQTKTSRARQRPPTDENTKAPAAAAAEGLHGGGLRKRVSVRGSPQGSHRKGGLRQGSPSTPRQTAVDHLQVPLHHAQKRAAAFVGHAQLVR